MYSCTHCAELIQEEARVCKHCQRPSLFDVWMIESFDQRELYELSKFLSERPQLSNISFQELKEISNSLPKCILQNLSKRECDDLVQSFKKLSFQLSPEKINEDRKNGISISTAAILIAGLFAISFYFWWSDRFKDENLSLNQSNEWVKPLSPTFDSNTDSKEVLSSTSEKIDSTNSQSKTEIIRALNASVFIRSRQSLGTGFLISADGFILTNTHVIDADDRPLIILRDGQQFSAKLIRKDENVDLSLLKIDAQNLDYFQIGDAHSLYPGQNILSIGNPSGLAFTLTRGIVSYVGREIDGVSYIQTDAAINPGNSGGPMITEDYKVVAINTLTAKGEEGISFALPINYAFESGGIAETLGESRRSMKSAAMKTAPTRYSSQDDSYQNEAKSYATEFEKTKNDLVEENKAILSELEEHRQKLQSSSLGILEKRRIQDRLQELKDQNSSLSNRLREAQVRYLRQMQSLLYRQKGDSRFSHLHEKIDLQLADIEDQKKKLEN
ncbi:MAG: S1C family serine protease [Bdellovibrionota bacterium]